MKFNEKQAQYLSNYLPSGVAWTAKNIKDSDLRKLLNGLGYEFQNLEDLVTYLKKELNIFTTVDFIDYWEKYYGIPDDCFSIDGLTLEQRRLQCYIKELMDGADRVEDWERIASLLSYDTRIIPARSLKFPYKFPILFTDIPNYTIVVNFVNTVRPCEFPLQFPFTFGTKSSHQLKKIFEKIKPADSIIVYNYINE